MRTWLVLLGGMIVWAVHFFGLYALASVLGSGVTARIGTALLTVACLAADVALLRACLRPADGQGGLPATLGASGAALSIVAILWQGLPAAIG